MASADRDAVGHFSTTVREFHAYYDHRPDFEERLPIWHQLLDKYAVSGGLSLDMGCGTGVFSFYLAQVPGQVIGIDGSADMIAFCNSQRSERGIQNVRFTQGLLPNLETTGLANADLIISSSVVEYVEELDESLELFSRLLKPGAALVLSMPNAFSVSRNVERLKYRVMQRPGIYRYIRHFSSPRLLQARARRYGLALEEFHHYAHPTRLAKVGRALGLPPTLTADLFAAAFRRE